MCRRIQPPPSRHTTPHRSDGGRIDCPPRCCAVVLSCSQSSYSHGHSRTHTPSSSSNTPAPVQHPHTSSSSPHSSASYFSPSSLLPSLLLLTPPTLGTSANLLPNHPSPLLSTLDPQPSLTVEGKLTTSSIPTPSPSHHHHRRTQTHSPSTRFLSRLPSQTQPQPHSIYHLQTPKTCQPTSERQATKAAPVTPHPSDRPTPPPHPTCG